MKKAILLLIIAASLSSANAQMYNYLGNHVILNMEGYFSPAWINPNPVSSGWDISEGAQHYLGLNYFLSPSLELIVWEKGTVGVGYNYYNSPFKGSDYRLSKPDAWGYYNPKTINGNVTAHGFNVYYKQYLGKGFAPLGHYFKFTFDGYFFHYQMDTTGLSSQLAMIPAEERDPIFDNKGSLFGFKAEYGYDFYVLNRLKLTLGMSLGTTFGGFQASIKTLREASPTSDFAESNNTPLFFDNYARGRILSAYWFGIKLGIGFLAF